MMELKVILDFACCNCHHTVNVTVQCKGKGLASPDQAVAAVNVPCPTCGSVNQLYFEPNGTVRTVAPFAAPRQMPEPSIN